MMTHVSAELNNNFITAEISQLYVTKSFSANWM